MKLINEKRTLTTIRLTTNQKKVMTRIISAPTAKSAADAVNMGRGMVAAREMLVKLGLIRYSNDSASITDEGRTVMVDSNLIDEMDKLTDEGNEYAFEEDKDKEKDKDQFSMEHPPRNRPTPEQPPMESLIKQVNNILVESPVFSAADIETLELADAGDLDLDEYPKLMDKLIDHYKAEMPYGVQKGRTGLPGDWIYHRLGTIIKELKHHVAVKAKKVVHESTVSPQESYDDKKLARLEKKLAVYTEIDFRDRVVSDYEMINKLRTEIASLKKAMKSKK